MKRVIVYLDCIQFLFCSIVFVSILIGFCLQFFFFFVIEVLTLSVCHDVTNDWEKDYEKFVDPLIEENTPCYILFRLDTKTPIGHEWLLISYTPDTATIRQKMLYASTKATLKKEFGSTHIKEEYHATSKVKFKLKSLRSFKQIDRNEKNYHHFFFHFYFVIYL